MNNKIIVGILFFALIFFSGCVQENKDYQCNSSNAEFCKELINNCNSSVLEYKDNTGESVYEWMTVSITKMEKICKIEYKIHTNEKINLHEESTISYYCEIPIEEEYLLYKTTLKYCEATIYPSGTAGEDFPTPDPVGIAEELTN